MKAMGKSTAISEEQKQEIVFQRQHEMCVPAFRSLCAMCW